MTNLVTAAAILILVGVSWAQNAAPTPPGQESKFAERFRRADSNGDGFISDAEARAAGLWFEDDFNGVDSDGSGTVTILEFGNALQSRLNRSMSEFDAADTNHDGRLSVDERRRSSAMMGVLKSSKRSKKATVSRPEYESYAIDRLYRGAELPSVAPNIIEKRF